jgi:acyl-coenzyme A thioesterase PaaI-like protein
MARKALTNTFPFDTCCFVCEQANPRGLRQQFFLDDGGARVIADFVPTREQSGAPNYAHGGASMAVLDDAMAWAIIAIKKRFGVTRRAEFSFDRPVRVRRQPRRRGLAWVESSAGRSLVARAELRTRDGGLCIAARADYTVITFEEATKAIGGGAKAAAGYSEPLA